MFCAGVWFQRAWRGWWLAWGEGRCGRRGRHRIRYQFRILRPGSGTISPRGGKIFWIHKFRQRGTSPVFIGDRYPYGTVNWWYFSQNRHSEFLFWCRLPPFKFVLCRTAFFFVRYRIGTFVFFYSIGTLIFLESGTSLCIGTLSYNCKSGPAFKSLGSKRRIRDLWIRYR